MKMPVLALLVAWGGAVWAAGPPVELVQSIPVETSLAQPDLRHAKDVWVEMIRGARKTIELGQFYVAGKAGSALDPVIDALAEAGKRGVRTRMLVSNVLFKEDPATLERLKQLPGFELRVYDITRLTHGIIHSKYWVLDGQAIFVGSQNFDWRALEHIHETGALVRSPQLARQLRAIFDADWDYAKAGKYSSRLIRDAKVDGAADGDVELVASPVQFNPRGIHAALPALVGLLGDAKKRIRVQLLDYSPVERYTVDEAKKLYRYEFWPELDNALRAAAVRGVKVELMVSDWNVKEPAYAHLRSLARISGIEVRMVAIPEHSGGKIPYARVIHSKLLVVDDGILWVGTSNWAKDYFIDSRNVELILRRRELAAKGDAIFEKLWGSSYAKKIE